MDYQVANALRKEKALSKQRGEILAIAPEKALDAILGAKQPATLIQSFPDQDLYYLMHHIGSEDFTPVLSLATSEQWEYFLDMDVWQGDRMDLPQVTRTLKMLFKADGPRLLRWIITEKPDFLEYYFFKSMEVRIREHDEDPSTFGDDFYTLDHQFYYRFPEIPPTVKEMVRDVALVGDDADADPAGELEKNRAQAETLISKMLNTLAEMDLSVCQAVLMESTAVIPAETEEEQYRLRNVRLAEKGFLPHYEAAGVYQPLDQESLSRRSATWFKSPRLDVDLPSSPGFTDTVMPRESLFSRSLEGVEEPLTGMLSTEFASLVNRVVSADGLRIQCRENLEAVVQKTAGYISVGMEVIHGRKQKCLPRHGAALLRQHPLEDIFRVGSGAGIRLKTVAENWYADSWMASRGLALTFLGESWLGVVGGLLLERPLYFDNYATGVLYRPFARLDEMAASSMTLSSVEAMDALLEAIQPEISPGIGEHLTWQSLLLTLWVRSCLDLSFTVDTIPMERFQLFFAALFEGEKEDPGGEKEGENTGRIARIKRDDFSMWLARVSGRADLCQRLSRVTAALFDAVASEFSRVRHTDLSPGLLESFFLVRR